MKLKLEKRIPSVEAKKTRIKIKYSEETLWRTTVKKARNIAAFPITIPAHAYNVAIFPIKKARGFFKWLNFPLIEMRSMHAAERSRSVKKWLKSPELGIKIKYVTEMRQALKIRDK